MRFLSWTPRHEGVLGSELELHTFLTSAPDGGEWSASRSGRSTSRGRTPGWRRLGGPQSRSGHGDEEKISQQLPGLEPPIVQPVDQHYTTELSQFTKDISKI
jgi:hypothetical protein